MLFNTELFDLIARICFSRMRCGRFLNNWNIKLFLRFVITSYSIHYTKLYEVGIFRLIAVFLLGFVKGS